jgi:manganese transport protein
VTPPVEAGSLAVEPNAIPIATPLERILARGRLRATLTMLGPAFVAAIAYVDPGNFGTNISAGALFGFLLLWVVLMANLMAMLVQYLSAKLGIVTDKNLPELCRERYPRPLTWFLWLQAEAIAMATDIAEFIGAALGLNLLFGVPLVAAGLITGVIAFALLELQRRGFRRFELAIMGLLGIILLGFVYEMLRITPPAQALAGFVPHLGSRDAILLAVGIIGATVMPHVIYLHSALTNGRVPARSDAERRRILRFERLDVLVALSLAGLVNMAMLAVAATLFHVPGLAPVTTIELAHQGFARLVGGGAALAFAVALLASGVSSSSVGTYSGQVVMAGFVNLRVSLFVRRAITMTPALALLAFGVDPTRALVLSQVVLSFGIPFALVPLVLLTSNKGIMGPHVNGRLTALLAWSVAGVIISLNAYLLAAQFLGV